MRALVMSSDGSNSRSIPACRAMVPPRLSGLSSLRWPSHCRIKEASSSRVCGRTLLVPMSLTIRPMNDKLVFRTAISHAEAIGLEPEFKHIANSAATLWRPSARFDLVRCGISIYGLSPNPQIASSRDLGLTPAMTVKATVVNAMDLPKGAGVSYGHTFVTEHPTRVALVPMGYAEGIPRHASNQAQVWLNGQRADLLGLVCMDQIVAAAPRAQIGDDVIVFGPGDHGEPTADEWAAWCQTMNYEIVTRIGGRAKRVVMTPRVQEGS